MARFILAAGLATGLAGCGGVPQTEVADLSAQLVACELREQAFARSFALLFEATQTLAERHAAGEDVSGDVESLQALWAEFASGVRIFNAIEDELVGR